MKQVLLRILRELDLRPTIVLNSIEKMLDKLNNA